MPLYSRTAKRVERKQRADWAEAERTARLEAGLSSGGEEDEEGDSEDEESEDEDEHMLSDEDGELCVWRG